MRTCPACGRDARTRDERCRVRGGVFDVRPPSLGARTAGWVLAAAALAALVRGRRSSASCTEDREGRPPPSALASPGSPCARASRRPTAPRADAPAGARSPANRPRRAPSPRLSAASPRRPARAPRPELEAPTARVRPDPASPRCGPDDRDLGRGRSGARLPGRQGAARCATRGTTVGRLGHPFVAALDFRRFTYVWCRNYAAA